MRSSGKSVRFYKLFKQKVKMIIELILEKQSK